jgi:hypothetical protein
MIVVEIIVLALLVVGGAGYYLLKFGRTSVAALESEEDKKKNRLRELLSAFELHYESIIESHNIQTADVDVEHLVDNTFIILKPDVDALLAFVNATDDNIQTRYTARYFNNTVALIDAYCSWRSKHPHLMLSEEQEKKMYTSVKDVIRADIQRRILTLKGTQGGLLFS